MARYRTKGKHRLEITKQIVKEADDFEDRLCLFKDGVCIKTDTPDKIKKELARAFGEVLDNMVRFNSQYLLEIDIKMKKLE